ncbi:hypothetical protein PVAP13_9KG521926 [Panicum virgatum]|uniref:Uncharacterized protein n=1 Tax=Panicum virgatum TaxID=38727 RepID=A0A8T0NVI2_PANVG|nr:hypothetical protein PVAP13_9KG521926 [Panicum virgatum]
MSPTVHPRADVKPYLIFSRDPRQLRLRGQPARGGVVLVVKPAVGAVQVQQHGGEVRRCCRGRGRRP